MRVRRRARTTAGLGGLASLALAASLSGCMTVHGEEAVVPAATEEEAEEALARFAEVANEANETYDTELNGTAETGPLAAIENARLTAWEQVPPDEDALPVPLEFTDATFHIPQQAGWPKFFVADTLSSRSEENRWVLTFVRNGVDEEWRAAYLAVMSPSDLPEFAEDEDGFAEDVPLTDDSGLVLDPAELPGGYTAYLKDGEGPFAEGPFTSGTLEVREENANTAAWVTQYEDLPAQEPGFEPVALRTADGGALVFFSTHHHEKQTMAEGETPVVDPLVEALMDGTAESSVTLVRVGMQVAHVPGASGDEVDEGDAGDAANEGDGEEIAVTGRLSGVVRAVGE